MLDKWHLKTFSAKAHWEGFPPHLLHLNLKLDSKVFYPDIIIYAMHMLKHLLLICVLFYLHLTRITHLVHQM